MSTNLMGELVANNGTIFLSGAGNGYSGNIDQIIVRGDGVIISRIYVTRDGEQVEVTEDYLFSTNVPDGLRITPQNNEVFSSVSLSGSSPNSVGLELVLA